MSGSSEHMIEETKGYSQPAGGKAAVKHSNGHHDVRVDDSKAHHATHSKTNAASKDSEKKLSGSSRFDDVFQDDFMIEKLMDFFTLEEIYAVFYQLNKTYSKLVDEANYLLLRKLTDAFHITSRYLTSDLPVHEKIVDVYREAMSSIRSEKESDLKPTAFYTDSGLVGTNMWYSFHNIFDTNTSNMYGGYVFSSNKGTNNHIQAYLCMPGTGVDNTFCQKMKKEYEMTPGSKEIRVAYEKYPADGSTPSFKIPKTFELNCRNQGYCYYADNILLCFSDSEVDNKKFQKSTKFFEKFKSVEDVKDSGIPILNINDSIKGFTAIEFDLSKKHTILNLLGIKQFVSVPLVYLQIDKNLLYGQSPSYNIIQNVAAKYLSMKLICCSTNQLGNQLDMFPCSLKGKSLTFG